jgi:tetratricopeptide (TPR) repeat protein
MSLISEKKALLSLILLCFFLIASYRIYHLVVADIHASIAERKFEAKDYTAAEHHMSRSISHDDSNPDYYYLQAQSLYALAKETPGFRDAQGLLRQALEQFQKSVELNPREGNAWHDLAQTSWWLSRFPGYEGEYQKVEVYLQKALATDPNNGKFLFAMVNYYLSSPKPEDCLPCLRRLAIVYPKAYHHLKENANWTGSFRDSYKEGLKAAIENPLTGRQALNMLGYLASEEEDWGSAIAYTEEFIRRSGLDNPSDSYITLGLYCLRGQDQPQARAAFLQALKLSKTRELTLLSILSPCVQSNALDLYLDLCGETAAFDAAVRSRLPLILGKAYFQGNHMEEAQGCFQQSVQTKETAEARRYLAEIAFRKKDWDAAEIQSQRATILEPVNSHNYFLFARSLEAQKKYKSALEAVSQAIRHAQPPDESYYAMQGALCWTLRDHGCAIEAWKAAHQLAPQNADTLRRIAEAYRMIHDFSHAEQYYLAALELIPQDETLHADLEAVRKQKQ